MSRIGGVTSPVKCEESLRTPIEIKQEQCDDEDSYGEPHATRMADSVVGKPPSSSMLAAETEDNYEFLGNLKYDADESTDATTTEPSKNLGIVCHLCQQVYCNKTRYGYHRKRDFIAHLVKVHDYSHLRGHRRLAQCKGCKIKRERWSFVVVEGNNYKFAEVCSRCRPTTCRPITDDSDSLQYPKNQNRQSITSLWNDFTAHQESNAGELQKRPEATEEAPTAAEEPNVQADESPDLTTTEPLSSKKRDENFCDLCQEDYYKKARYGDNKKRYFVAHLVKAHNYVHLRGYSVFAQCPVCKIEKGRWSFVVGEGNNYKFSEECTTCQMKDRRSGAWMASQMEEFHGPSSVERW